MPRRQKKNKDTRPRRDSSRRARTSATSRRHEPARDRAYADARARFGATPRRVKGAKTYEPTASRPGYVSYAASMPSGTSSEHGPSPYAREGYGAASPVVGSVNISDVSRDARATSKGRLPAFLSPASPNKAPMPAGFSRPARRRAAHYTAKGPFHTLVPAFLLVMVAALAATALAGTLFVRSAMSDLPAVDGDSLSKYAETGITSIYANDASTVLAKIYTVNRIRVGNDEISQHVKDATVATEDARFYEHSGIDPVGIVRAAGATVTGGQQGGSTITQQLVRNTVLLDEMSEISISRKLREIALAMKVEEMYTKDEILGLYLNIVNYGNGNYGIEAAARDYFGCSASELTLSQATLLAGIPQSPNYYNPRENYDGALERRKIVLWRMLDEHMISGDEYEQALADSPELAEEGAFGDEVSDIAPYFVDYVKELLQDGPDGAQPLPASISGKGGLSIVTSLDVSAQQAANTSVSEVMDGRYDSMDAALVSVKPDTGEIVSMYGGRSYASNQFNLAAQMSRQAGSSFKPFALVAALQEGVSPNYITLPAAGPITIGSWKVDNSDGEGSGRVNLTQATAQSLNTVYAMVTHGIGPDKVAAAAHAMGVESELNAVDSICLGTQGINPLEMASAYGTLANNGVRKSPVAILSVKDSSGSTLYEYDKSSDGEQVVSQGVAQDATKILQTVISGGTGTGARLANGQPAAGKTGTSENGRDMWFVGYTPQYSTAVWTGNRDDTPTYLYGSTTSTPIWKNYMDKVLYGTAAQPFPSGAEAPRYYTDWDFTSYVSR